jgi:DNA-binding GntR family transcriptional regulator
MHFDVNSKLLTGKIMDKHHKLYKRKLRFLPLADQACNLIKEVILQGKYNPNQRLNEVELSSSLGISRGPIREALQKLAYEGLVKLVPNKGAFIIDFSLEEVEEIYELREYLEVLSVRLAVERSNESDLRKLSESLKVVERTIEKNQYSYYPWELDYHLHIARSTKNNKIEEIIQKLNAQMLLIRYTSGRKHGRAIEAFKEHYEIYEALCARDSEKAQHLMIEHIHNSKKNIIKIISQGIKNCSE